MIPFNIVDMYKEMITMTIVILITHSDAHAYSVYTKLYTYTLIYTHLYI